MLHPDYQLATLWDEHKSRGKRPTAVVITKQTYCVADQPKWKGEVANLYRVVHQAPDGSEVVSWPKMAREDPRTPVLSRVRSWCVGCS